MVPRWLRPFGVLLLALAQIRSQRLLQARLSL